MRKIIIFVDRDSGEKGRFFLKIRWRRENENIEFKRHTESLTELFEALKISKRTMVIPSDSATSNVIKQSSQNSQDNQQVGSSYFSDWYDCEFDIKFREEAIHLGEEYNKIITLLRIDDDPDEILENLREDETWRPKYDMN